MRGLHRMLNYQAHVLSKKLWILGFFQVNTLKVSGSCAIKCQWEPPHRCLCVCQVGPQLSARNYKISIRSQWGCRLNVCCFTKWISCFFFFFSVAAKLHKKLRCRIRGKAKLWHMRRKGWYYCLNYRWFAWGPFAKKRKEGILIPKWDFAISIVSRSYQQNVHDFTNSRKPKGVTPYGCYGNMN